MYFLDSLPNISDKIKIIEASGGTAGTQDMIPVSIPSWASFVNIIAIGPGGGGGGGSVAAAGVAVAGGGGGGSGGVSKLILSTLFLPSMVYVTGGRGGNGGASAGNGTAGTALYVLAYPDTTLSADSVILRANGGGGGAATGTGGSAATVATAANSIYGQSASVSLFNSASSYLAGVIGAAGASGASGTTAVIATAATSFLFTTPGAGGGGVNASNTTQQGGGITATSLLFAQYNIPATGIGVDGSGGYKLSTQFFGTTNKIPMIGTGGCGGGGANGVSITAGSGGNGGPGCGGGGGGGANGTTVTGGGGGQGGNGLVIFQFI